MKLIDYINNNKKTHFSIEILPPLKGESMQSLITGLTPLIDFKPACIDVTYHREDVNYIKQSNGQYKKIIQRRRPGTIGISAALQIKFGITTIPHILCGGFTKEDTENLLIDLDFLGIQNVMALRGDLQKSQLHFEADEGGHLYAVDLVEQISNLNRGKFLHEDIKIKNNTDFCIGVAAYPEKHDEAPNIDFDIDILKSKLDKGANFVVTQMFFDNAYFYQFVEKCRKAGIKAPIIPGLKPLTSKRQLQLLPKAFALSIPTELSREVLKCKDNNAVKQVGIEWCIQQSKDLVDKVPLLHYYTMSRSESMMQIIPNVF